MSQQIKKEGWVAITPTLCQGDIMAWAVSEKDDDEEYPDVYATRAEVLEEMKDDPDGDDYVAQYKEYADGRIVVTNEDNMVIIETTLKEWRKNR